MRRLCAFATLAHVAAEAPGRLIQRNAPVHADGIRADAGHEVEHLAAADTEFARYALASDSERTELLKDWVTPDLIILDDLFLARRISEHAAEVLQAIVHQRYKLRRAIVVTSNRVVQDWGRYLGDATMATTILDRLMHRCTMLEFEGKSYRLKEAAARIAIGTESS